MFFETIAKFDTFQFICGTPNVCSSRYPFEYIIFFSKSLQFGASDKVHMHNIHLNFVAHIQHVFH